MKTLFLLRHAKSSWVEPGQRDFERPLNARGQAAAHALGRELRRLGLAADHILASPARRVVETLDALAQGYGGRMMVQYEPKIYLASAALLLDLVHRAEDSHQGLMIAGHNPGMAELTLMLSGAGAERDQVAAKYPTGALAELHFTGESWRDVAPGTGSLARFLRPRDLDQGSDKP
jgi:phosphohistidine phosphatase